MIISKVLVANRAEIASRVFRTCRRLGIGTVAVHSDADADLPYVAEADLAVRLPGSTPAETYLRGELVIEAARKAGADAIHPGYGFLSESAEFARAVTDAGLVWIGPTPDSIEQMGSKVGAKKIMEAAGVPVLSAPDAPTEADLPLLVKASAGGGGRGMRIVRSLEALDAEIAAARAEAESAFGDGTVFVEPYVEVGRHVEVQVVGDGRGGVLVLGERDCSLQRRHQKVVEEAPAPGLRDETRAALHEAARAAAAAIDYRGAGTVEFLLDPATQRFWFLEMNTRLQVEHPVTELVHGVDLVELQLQVAEGGGLETTTSTPPSGHAIEVRLYAEDPAADYQPQSGTLTCFEIGDEGEVRVDAGYATGSTVSTFYDAMLAKVIAHAPTRDGAIRKLVAALRRARIHGLVTNRDQLIDALTSPEFVAGEVSTALLASRVGESDPGARLTRTTAAAAALAVVETARARATVQRRIPAGWRNVVSQPQRVDLTTVTGDVVRVEWYGTRDGYVLAGAHEDVRVLAATPGSVTLERDGVAATYAVAVRGDAVDVDGPDGHVAYRRVPRFTDPSTVRAPGSLLAPMPGTVVAVHAAVGDTVTEGSPLLVLEAMKMQHTVSAPVDGVLSTLHVAVGAQVAAEEVLAVVEPSEQPEEQA